MPACPIAVEEQEWVQHGFVELFLHNIIVPCLLNANAIVRNHSVSEV